MSKKKEPVRVIPLPAGVEIGKLVRYYYEGWRVGTFEERDGNLVGIRPFGNNKRLKWINVGEIEAVHGQGKECQKNKT